eukprot:c56889_g1_i1 orf=104-295(-)
MLSSLPCSMMAYYIPCYDSHKSKILSFILYSQPNSIRIKALILCLEADCHACHNVLPLFANEI